MRSIEIPGFRDEAVEKYCAWHTTQQWGPRLHGGPGQRIIL